MSKFFIYSLLFILLFNITILPCHCDDNSIPNAQSSDNTEQEH